MSTCKTCAHWRHPEADDSFYSRDLCQPKDPDTYEPMDRGFEVRICKQPTQTFAESPTESNGFGLTDASQYFAVLATAEDFGCVRHEPATPERTPQ
jgi:hypothetical protein